MYKIYLILVFLCSSTINCQTLIKNIKVFDSTNSQISRNFYFLQRDSIIINEKVKSTKIYYNSSGYDELRLFVNNNLKVDTILNKNSSYPLFIIEVEIRDCKNKNITIEIKQKNKFFSFSLPSGYQSVVIFPHVGEKLANFTGEVKEEKEEVNFSGVKDFIEIHLLKFDYYDYLIKQLSR